MSPLFLRLPHSLRGTRQTCEVPSFVLDLNSILRALGGAAGGTGKRVAREPLTGRVAAGLMARERSGPVGERATRSPGQDRSPRASTRSRPRFLGAFQARHGLCGVLSETWLSTTRRRSLRERPGDGRCSCPTRRARLVPEASGAPRGTSGGSIVC